MKYIFDYYCGGERKFSDSAENDDFSVEVTNSDGRITACIIPKTEIEFERFAIVCNCLVRRNQRVFTNGYQSWTLSREYDPNERMDEFKPTVLGVEKSKINPLGIWGAGDMLWHKYPTQRGVFYGYSYAYIRDGENIRLYASLSEREGFTILTFNTNDDTVTIEKDLQGVRFSEKKQVLDLVVIKDEYDAAFDEYFRLMGIDAPRVERKCGYTTWYNYYTGVTEKIVKRDLEAISRLDKKVDIFQIDDGYERTVGDWLIADSVKFPSGMKATADDIHNEGLLAGLWLAPFAATPRSEIYRNHRDWLVCDEKGERHFCSHNWGGFFALDFYNSEVRDYIRKVFDTVLNEWGYDMVKLDFLYACCQRPIHNKSRGAIMCEAMDFIRECCGDKIILGCGVPLAPAFGKVDFCRIGADVGLTWRNTAYAREDVSTQNTLTNTIYRRSLDGRAWLNDPDVFLLRDENINMTLEQRELIAAVNSICGNLLFVSDDVSSYNEKQTQIFLDTITRRKPKILSAQIKNGVADIKTDGGIMRFNLKIGKIIQKI